MYISVVCAWARVVSFGCQWDFLCTGKFISLGDAGKTARLAVCAVIFVLYSVLSTVYGEHRRISKCLHVIRPC